MLGKLGSKVFSRTVELAKPVVNRNGATVTKLKKGSDLITKVNYSDTHRLAQKFGLKECTIITKPDGQKVHKAIIQNTAGDTLEFDTGILMSYMKHARKGLSRDLFFRFQSFMNRVGGLMES